ncbi:fungal-specific transcription factor domain-containing protein [Hygrophoropsis aurantiaca]|uniref:Fungal-specific transcription factor domain-containing protein n=1 Tax=Hygrophoropsis aurantiaca TaxID=72124 RepID=A0ACB7ZZG7_9AGAM|nr:fungal-specific transcription factor domain-containing protein [Hygrophoropsis aurantiaca]
MQDPSEFIDDQSKSSSKPPIIRNPRACTVCRAAKMKCVGAEDGQQPCQRCKRTNVECVFEKHRRGRKPGSKLSEASKMLRRLEKGLNNAKQKASDYPAGPRSVPTESSHFPDIMRSGDAYGSSDGYEPSVTSGSRTMDVDDDEDTERCDEKFPAKLIGKENSFFSKILNPEPKSPALPPSSRGNSYPLHQLRPAPLPSGLHDPITAGLISESKAKVLFDAIFLRLNPFINLFDPALHSVAYVRSKCPLLFTTLIMAGCKFFEPSLYKDCLKLAHELAVRAFAEGWKRVEVVQAFACLTYWREQDDNRTWMYIGYACRMAVELGMNRYVAHPPTHETEFHLLERRNRERTYLVLFVHDRSLSLQTGRHWMLPEDDFIRHSDTWHERGGSSIRCEDVVISAFTQLRRIAAETTDMFHTNRSLADNGNNQVNIDIVLKNCNSKLAQWTTTWEHEMRRAGGESFHFSFLTFFCLYSRLFLNSFGVQASIPPANRTSSHLRALSACFDNALDVLRIASKEFRDLGVLRYGQETTSVMTAYSAIFLLKLLRSSSTRTDLHTELHEGAAQEIYASITKTAEAYHEASLSSPTSSSAAYHARFLTSLVHNDLRKMRDNDRRTNTAPISPPIAGDQHLPSASSSPPQGYPQQHAPPYEYSYTPSPNGLPNSGYPAHNYSDPNARPVNYTPLQPQPPYLQPPPSETDFHYFRHMLMDLGFGEHNDQTAISSHDGFRNINAYGDNSQFPYSQMNSLQTGFGSQ